MLKKYNVLGEGAVHATELAQAMDYAKDSQRLRTCRKDRMLRSIKNIVESMEQSGIPVLKELGVQMPRTSKVAKSVVKVVETIRINPKWDKDGTTIVTLDTNSDIVIGSGNNDSVGTKFGTVLLPKFAWKASIFTTDGQSVKGVVEVSNDWVVRTTQPEVTALRIDARLNNEQFDLNKIE